jgi:autotransporter adhesin
MGTGAQALAPNSLALGPGAIVQLGATNSVAIGQGSIATLPNTVSFGTPGNLRRLTNLAPGIDPNDAVTVSQLSGLLSGDVDREIRKALAGAAMGMAYNAVDLSLDPGEQGLVAGVGYYEDETAFTMRYQYRPNENVFLGVGAGVTEANDWSPGVSGGIGVKW